jgi:hypothetical protein
MDLLREYRTAEFERVKVSVPEAVDSIPEAIAEALILIGASLTVQLLKSIPGIGDDRYVRRSFQLTFDQAAVEHFVRYVTDVDAGFPSLYEDRKISRLTLETHLLNQLLALTGEELPPSVLLSAAVVKYCVANLLYKFYCNPLQITDVQLRNKLFFQPIDSFIPNY